MSHFLRQTHTLCVLLLLCTGIAPRVSVQGQTAVLIDPILDAQRLAPSVHASALDPIEAAQVMAQARRTFPNLAEDLKYGDLLSKAVQDPRMRGNLIGRLAEVDFFDRNNSWKPSLKANAPENDGWRWVDGKVGGQREGIQIKTHADWKKYVPEMLNKDTKAEYYAIPDDHYNRVYQELEQRRVGALRGGFTEKAGDYARQQKRLSKIGRTFAELEGSVLSACKHYGRISAALRAAGKATPLLGVALGLLDGAYAVHELATGRIEVGAFVEKVAKIGVKTAASIFAAQASQTAAVAAGLSGAVPIAVAIVIGTVTYLVVDWAVEAAVKSLEPAELSAKDLALLWPKDRRPPGLDPVGRR